MPKYSHKDHEALAQVRANLAADLEGVPQYPDAYGDRKFIRFLQGHNYDVEKATEMIGKYIQWRKDNNVDKIRNEIIFGGMNHPTKFPKAELIMRLIPSLPITFDSLDKYDSPICVDQYDFTPSDVLSQITIEDYLVFATHILEYRNIIVDQLSEHHDRKHLASLADDAARTAALDPVGEGEPWGRIIFTCVIRDLGAVGFRHLGSDGQEIIKTVVSLSSDNYPELLRKCIMINTPWVFTSIWYLIKGWLAPRTVAKVSLVGTSYNDEVLGEMAENMVPSMIGGPCKEDPTKIYPFDRDFFTVPGMPEEYSGAAYSGSGTSVTSESSSNNGSSDPMPPQPPTAAQTEQGENDIEKESGTWKEKEPTPVPTPAPVPAPAQMAKSPESESPLQKLGHV